MGNQHSIQREEREEEEFRLLAQAFKDARLRHDSGPDLEAGREHVAHGHALGGFNPVTGVFHPYFGSLGHDRFTRSTYMRAPRRNQVVAEPYPPQTISSVLPDLRPTRPIIIQPPLPLSAPPFNNPPDVQAIASRPCTPPVVILPASSPLPRVCTPPTPPSYQPDEYQATEAIPVPPGMIVPSQLDDTQTLGPHTDPVIVHEDRPASPRPSVVHHERFPSDDEREFIEARLHARSPSPRDSPTTPSPIVVCVPTVVRPHGEPYGHANRRSQMSSPVHERCGTHSPSEISRVSTADGSCHEESHRMRRWSARTRSFSLPRDRAVSPSRYTPPLQSPDDFMPGIFSEDASRQCRSVPHSYREVPVTRTSSREGSPDHKLHGVSRSYIHALEEWGDHMKQWQEREAKLLTLIERIARINTERGASHMEPSVCSQSGDESDGRSSLSEKASMQSEFAQLAKPYPNRAFAAGLAISKKSCGDGWKPDWDGVFPLKVFRGAEYRVVRIPAHWDDESLLRELRKTYDGLRKVWRKWFSLRNVGSMTIVLEDHSFIYPQRIGPARVSPAKNMRLRWFLHHPEYMKGRHEFMQVLTADPDLGIEFVERWQLSRIAIAVLIPVFASLAIGVVYSGVMDDPSTGFTIAGYVTSAYSVCLVLVGLLNLVDF